MELGNEKGKGVLFVSALKDINEMQNPHKSRIRDEEWNFKVFESRIV